MRAGPPPGPLRLTSEVAAALAAGRPVVALETSVIAQGLPIPHNRAAAAQMMGAVTRRGVVPALVAVVEGQPTLGLTVLELERFLGRDGIDKLSSRDLAFAMIRGRSGATTVAATLALLVQTEVRVFATGGIGGVHRDAAFDESADLIELSRAGAIVVCAGAKSILDLPATLERLETLSIPVVGYRTREFPAFFCRTSGLPVSLTVETPAEVVALFRAHRALGRRESLLVVQPPPADAAQPTELIEAAVAAALADARAQGIRGPATTPFLLAAVERATGGRSLQTNLALLECNAELAAEIAIALTA